MCNLQYIFIGLQNFLITGHKRLNFVLSLVLQREHYGTGDGSELEREREREREREKTSFVLFPSRQNLYSPGCVKGYPHRAEGECDTRAFLRSSFLCPSIITSLTSLRKNNDFHDRFSFVSFIFPCVHLLRVCINRRNLIAYYLAVNFITKESYLLSPGLLILLDII